MNWKNHQYLYAKCEHFCEWCINDEQRSEQIEQEKKQQTQWNKASS
jgi:hypothetical protein